MNNRPATRRFTSVVLSVAALWVAVLAALLANLPFASDSIIAVSRVAEFDGPGEVFALAPIYRPFELLWFYVIERSGLDEPWVARILPFTKHLLVCVLLFVLARRLGAGRGGAAVAVLLFVLAPNSKLLAWVMAHSTQGRVMWTLAGFLAFLRFEEHRRLRSAAAAVTCFVFGLLNHPGAIELPILCVAWLLFGRDLPMQRALIETRRRVPTLALGSLLVIGLGYVYFTLFLLPDRYHGLKELAAIPANVVRSSTCFLPEWLRHLAVEGLRGDQGASGLLAGGTIVAGALGAAGMLFWRGTSASRFLVIAAGIDLAIPVLTTGFAQRHGYLIFGLVAVGIGVSITRRSRLAVAGALILGASWAIDTVVDVYEQRQAGAIIERVIDDCSAARAQVDNRTLIVAVNLPCAWGADQDIPVLNWGFRQALRRANVPGRFAAWRTTPAGTSTSQVLVDRADLENRAAELKAVVLWFDPEVLGLAPRAPTLDGD